MLYICYIYKCTNTIEGTATVQVKWVDGNTFIVKMYEDALIRDVRNEITIYIENHPEFHESEVREFELRSAYPPRILTDLLTLSEAKLVPNGTIYLRVITS